MPRKKTIEALTHGYARRKNIPPAGLQSVAQHAEEKSPSKPASYKRKVKLANGKTRPRDEDLDPQLTWRGKDQQDWSDLVVEKPPIYIQEKIHPKAIIENLKHQAKERQESQAETSDLFADYNGLDPEAQTEFYQHDQNWQNRLILGDSLQVMASLAEREGMRGQVQCIYVDPPYGIKFNSNFQHSTNSRDVKDGNIEHITREPEQIKAFRDTWKDGIHSYLTYLRDRLTVAHALLSKSGSIFVQIGAENVHRVRVMMDEVFGEKNFVNLITYRTSSGATQQFSVRSISNYIIWYCKNSSSIKFRRLLEKKKLDTGIYNQLELLDGSRRPMTTEERNDPSQCPSNSHPYRKSSLNSQGAGDKSPRRVYGSDWQVPSTRHWAHSLIGFERLVKASRVQPDKTALSAVLLPSRLSGR